MKNILITGGAGYIGSHAVKLFLEKGYEVTVFDNLSRGYKEAIDILSKYGKLKFVKGDLRNKSDLTKLFENSDFEAVLHFAALCIVNESMEKPELYFENNVVGSLNLFEQMRLSDVKKIIFSSTCAIYKEVEYLPIDVKHPVGPTSPYGESKLLTEKILRWYGEIHDFKYQILRYFNVCGADSEGLIGDSKKPSMLLVQNAVRGAMGIEKFYLTCAKVDTPDGSTIRDYIDVEDLVNAHFLALKCIESNSERILNLGNGTGYSTKEIVAAVEKEFNIKMNPVQAEPRKGELSKIYANPDPAQKTLNWKAKKGLKDSIESLRKWYTNHPNGYSY